MPTNSKTRKVIASVTNSRRSLLAAVLTLQALVIGAGWYITTSKAEREVSHRVLDEVLEERRHSVERFVALLEREAAGRLEPGTPAWEKAQSFVEAYRLPQGATLMILDDVGMVICHPEMRRAAGLFKSDFGLTTVRMSESGDELPLGMIRSNRGVIGATQTEAGEVAIAAAYSPTLDAIVVARQPRLENSAPGVRVMDGVTLWSGVAAIVVLALSAAGSIALVRRYNAMLVKMNEDLSKEVERQVASATTIRNGIIMGLAKLADHRDNETGRHLERIRTYCEMLAHELRGVHAEIDDAWIERLSVTSTMHDIGKVGIPDSVLLKPGRLTDEERRVMERHPLIGADTLVEVRRHVGEDDLVDMATEISLYHHEKWDGSGYPFGLGTTEIPLSARIVALADVYDALTSWRVYKKAMSHAEAKAIILGGHGTHFDPAIVDAFERIEARFNEVRQTMDEDNVMSLRIAPETLAA